MGSGHFRLYYPLVQAGCGPSAALARVGRAERTPTAGELIGGGALKYAVREYVRWRGTAAEATRRVSARWHRAPRARRPTP